MGPYACKFTHIVLNTKALFILRRWTWYEFNPETRLFSTQLNFNSQRALSLCESECMRKFLILKRVCYSKCLSFTNKKRIELIQYLHKNDAKFESEFLISCKNQICTIWYKWDWMNFMKKKISLDFTFVHKLEITFKFLIL